MVALVLFTLGGIFARGPPGRVKIALEPGLDLVEVAETINRAEAAVRQAVPSAGILYVEPDVVVSDQAAGGGRGGSLNDPGGERPTTTDA